MNNKGFMMAEVIVVSSIILLSLVGFYSLYTKTISVYNTRLDYYDVDTLYELASFRNTTKTYKQIDYSIGYNKQLELAGSDSKKIIYLLKYDKLNELRSSDKVVNQTFKDYLGYLSSKFIEKNKTYKFKYNDHILVMEKCNNDATDCKYAYLETAVK